MKKKGNPNLENMFTNIFFSKKELDLKYVF